MQTKTQEFDWLDEKLSENALTELDEQSAAGALRVRIEDELETALGELQELKDKLNEGESAKLLELCKENAINTLTSQFGLASLVVTAKDGGSVTTIHNAKNDVFANKGDETNYKRPYDSDKYHGENDNYKKGKQKLKKQAENGKLNDIYTGEELNKDGWDTEHVKPAKQIHDDPRAKLAMTEEQSSDLANSDVNLGATNSSINRSLGAKDKLQWITENGGDINADTTTVTIQGKQHKIDVKALKQKIKEAEGKINSELNKALLKKYTKDVVKTGAIDAGKMAVYSALAVVLRDFIEAAIIEIKVTLKNFGDESLSEVVARFKERMKTVFSELKAKWKDIFAGSLEGALTAFFSNLIVFLVNLVTTTLKKIVSIIRAGFVSLCQAVKLVINPPANMDKDDVYYEAFKILVAGIMGAISLTFAAGIEGFLSTVPGLNVITNLPLPFSEGNTVGGAFAVTISALLGGVATTIVLYYMDKFRSESKKSKLKFELMTKSGEVVTLRVAQTWFVLADGYETLVDSALHSRRTLAIVQSTIITSGEVTSRKIKSNFDEIDDALKELENL